MRQPELMFGAWVAAVALLSGCSGSDAADAGGVGVDAATADAATADAATADAADVAGGDAWVYSPRPISPLLLSNQVLIIAHRGGRTVRPGHTQAAYEEAVAVGAHLLEMDLHRTSDGVLVAIHDATVDRTTDGTGLVKEMTWPQLAKLDAGYTWSADGGKTFPYRGKGLRVARADETLAAFPNLHFSVELKQFDPPIVDDVMQLFEQHDAVHRTIFASFSDTTIQALRKRSPVAPTAMALGEMLIYQGLSDVERAAYTPPCVFVQPPWESVTAAFVTAAHKVGLKVHPWTINKPKDMQTLIALGVDGLFTDDPGSLAKLLAP